MVKSVITPQIFIQYVVFPQEFSKHFKISGKILSKYTNSKFCRNAYIQDKEVIISVLNGAFRQL